MGRAKQNPSTTSDTMFGKVFEIFRSIIFVALVLGAVTTIVSVSYSFRASVDHQRDIFHREVNLIENELARMINMTDELIHNMRFVFALFADIDADSFRLLSEDVLDRHDYIDAAIYLPLVTDSERERFELNMRERGYTTFSINEQTHGQWMPALSRDRYFPVIYQEPFSPLVASQMGYDFLSNVQMQAAINRAIDYGYAAVTDMQHSDKNEFSYYIFKAIYSGKHTPEQMDDRHTSVTGLVALKVNGSMMLKNVLQNDHLSVKFAAQPFSTKYARVRSTHAAHRPAIETDAWLIEWLDVQRIISSDNKSFILWIRKQVHWQDIEYSSIAVTAAIGIFITFFLTFLARNISLKSQALKLRNQEIQSLVDVLEAKNKKLSDVSQQVKKSSVAKDTFFANMSHELRTPLNAIIGYSELLLESVEDSSNTMDIEDLGRIRNSGKHLLSLVNDILDLSKIEAGKIDLLLEQFDMCELIASVLNELKPLAKNNHNELIFCPQKQPVQLFSDVMRVRQILLNLLGNACKFTDQGAISVTVIQQAKVCVIKICDTGIGITEEQMKKLFKNFSQADASTTRKYGGTGLGLAYSLKLCQLLGGELLLDSEYTKGTLATVRLPTRLTSSNGLDKQKNNTSA